MNMRELVRDLEARQALVRQMGGAERVAKQHARGKLTARERLAAFFDDGVFFEVGMHGTQMGLAAGPDGKDRPPRTRWCAASARSTGAWCAVPRTTSR
jgi:acetyl-CoA carboxylase carboxyltransferase component